MLAVGDGRDGRAALMKISGDLVRLDAVDAAADGGAFSAEGLSAEIAPTDDKSLFDMVVTADGYEAGFRGQYLCAE